MATETHPQPQPQRQPNEAVRQVALKVLKGEHDLEAALERAGVSGETVHELARMGLLEPLLHGLVAQRLGRETPHLALPAFQELEQATP